MQGAAEESIWGGWIFKGVMAINAVLLVYALIYRWRRGRWPFMEPWSLADIWFGAQLTLLGVAIAFGPVLTLTETFFPKVRIDSPNYGDRDTLLGFLLPAALLQNVVFFVVPMAYVVLKYRRSLREIGLPTVPNREDWRKGLLYGTGAMLVSEGVNRGLMWLAEANRNIPWVAAVLRYEESGPMAAIAKGLPSLGWIGLIVAVLALGIAPALGEEMFFRGFVFTAVKKQWGVVMGVVLSGLAFTIGHSYALGLISVFIMGTLLALAYHRTGSLWVPIIMHAANNTLLVVLAFFLP